MKMITTWGLSNEQRNNELIFFKVATIIKLKCIQKYIRKKLQLTTIMYNGQTSGQKSEFHHDSPTTGLNDDSVWTFVHFTEHYWNTQWGGELVVQYPVGDEFDYFYAPYIPNSGVLFKSGWEHFGASPNHCTDNLRTTVGYTFTETSVLDERMKTPFGDKVMKYLEYIVLEFNIVYGVSGIQAHQTILVLNASYEPLNITTSSCTSFKREGTTAFC